MKRWHSGKSSLNRSRSFAERSKWSICESQSRTSLKMTTAMNSSRLPRRSIEFVHLHPWFMCTVDLEWVVRQPWVLSSSASSRKSKTGRSCIVLTSTCRTSCWRYSQISKWFKESLTKMHSSRTTSNPAFLRITQLCHLRAQNNSAPSPPRSHSLKTPNQCQWRIPRWKMIRLNNNQWSTISTSRIETMKVLSLTRLKIIW